MLKALSKVVDILCNLELIYPPGFLDIMIYLVIHLPLEAFEGGPIRAMWSILCAILKNFTTKFNRLDHNVDCPPPSCQFQVFRSVCKSTGLWLVIRIDHQKLKKVIWVVIVVEDNSDIIHVDNSSDLALTTSVNDLKIMALHIDGQSLDVYAPPDIIDVDKDDDIIDDEDVLPRDLANSDDEDLINVDDDDGVAVVYSNVARGHGGDDGGDDRPPPHQLADGCQGKGTRKPNLGGRKADRMHTRKETRNLGLRKIMVELGPQPIWLRTSMTRLTTIRFGCPANISMKDWDKQIRFWSNTKNMTRGSDAAKDDESGDDEDADEDEKDADS
nr:hypothetical protein [Tanacetum cinerariifolium]